METKANYTVIGLFTLAIVVCVFGFVFWFQNIGGGAERAYFRVVFDGSVSGLRAGATVLFNGVHVGEVTRLSLDPEHPQQVIATMAVNKAVKLRADTVVGLEYTALTGVAAIALQGGSANLPPLDGPKDNPPLLKAGATQDVTQTARDALRRLDDFVADNQKSFHDTLDNLAKFTGALARNSERLDKIVAGLESLTSGTDGKGGELGEAVRSIGALSDNLDKRTESITKGVNLFTAAGTKQINAIGTDAHRMMGEIEKMVKNIDQNPSRLLFGGSDKKKE